MNTPYVVIVSDDKNKANLLAGELELKNHLFVSSIYSPDNSIEQIIGRLRSSKPKYIIINDIHAALSLATLLGKLLDVEVQIYNGIRNITMEEATYIASKRVFVITMPKSASQWLRSRLEKALITSVKFPAGGNWTHPCGQLLSDHHQLNNFERQGNLAIGHFAANDYNKALFEELANNCDVKYILLLRDPRQAFLSWIKFLPSLMGYTKAAIYSVNKESMKTDDFENCYEQYYLKLVAFAEKWMEYLDKHDIAKRFLVLTQEQLANDSLAFNQQVANWLDIKEQDLLLGDRPQVDTLHFRKGLTSEWKKYFTIRQQEKLNSALPASLIKRMGWN